MQPDTQSSTHLRIYLIEFILRKNSQQNTRQYITAAGRCHTGIPGGVDIHLPSPAGRLRPMALKDNDNARFAAQPTLGPQSFLSVLKTAEKTLKLLCMRREYGGSPLGMLPQEREAVAHAREHIEAVGIDNEGFVPSSLHKAAKRLQAVGTQTRPHSYGIVAPEFVSREKMGPMGVAVIDRDHRLRHGRLHHLHTPLRHMDREESYA